ncbi:ankyrin repeat domain-containing protein [Bacteroides sp. 224]|uniref:ankyrin repeat domain-containing protein n=1 Tax=Bacteroides sp. 224 TaxID=2302936 RepID=UPI0013D55F6F|nr:ankyrin repeat domain-containing protein [Bacteroides sp. 224]
MRKKSKLIFLTMLVCCFISCKTQTESKQTNKLYQTIEKDNFVLILEYLGNEKTDSLNLLLSHICKKEKIDISDWDTKYIDSGFSHNYHIDYRLIILYGINFKKIEPDWENRLNFFIASVYLNDYEILDLLDFKDTALEGNSCYGNTVLTTAVRQNNTKMVKYLLDRGVDKNKRELATCYDDSEEEMNAYEIALSLGNKELIDLLKD